LVSTPEPLKLSISGTMGAPAVAEPFALVAVTSASMVCPVSADATVYVLDVAPAMFAQPVPSPAQSCHW
jgi:hypothetical protein